MAKRHAESERESCTELAMVTFKKTEQGAKLLLLYYYVGTVSAKLRFHPPTYPACDHNIIIIFLNSIRSILFYFL